MHPVVPVARCLSDVTDVVDNWFSVSGDSDVVKSLESVWGVSDVVTTV